MLVDDVLKLAKAGIFGTPENPNRGSSGKSHFWNAYFGIKDNNLIPGSIGEIYAKAGKRYKTINHTHS